MRVLCKKPQYCMKCHACESTCSRTWFKEKDHEKARLRIIDPPSGSGRPEMRTCTQCGKCIPICPVTAIYRDEAGIVQINNEKCIGCYACVTGCPEKAMFDHKTYLPAFKCVSCGECTRVCPTNAIYIEEKPIPEESY